jgi:hypothetical protein
MVFVVACSCAGGSMLTASAQEPEIDPEAARILQAMSDTLAGATSFGVRAHALYQELQPSGMSYLREQTFVIFARRPDGLHARTRRDDGVEIYFWYDGAHLARLVEAADERLYSRIEVPDTIDTMLDFVAENYHQNMPLADLLYSDPYAAFSEHLISGAYLGERSVGGQPAHHLSFESYGSDIELWVAAEGDPVPLRFAIAYVNQPGEPAFVAEFEQWKLSPYLDPGMFGFTPPADAEEIAAARRE